MHTMNGTRVKIELEGGGEELHHAIIWTNHPELLTTEGRRYMAAKMHQCLSDLGLNVVSTRAVEQLETELCIDATIE